MSFLTLASGHVCLAVFVAIATASTSQADDNASIASFIQENCFDCHTGEDAEAGVDLDGLRADVSAPVAMASWVNVFDRVAGREMPPPDADQPDPKSRTEFLQQLDTSLTKADRARQEQLGRTVYRRLNRIEFENTLSEVFVMPQPVAEFLPADASAHGFENVGEAMRLSYVQMESYFDAIDEALDRATVRIAKPPMQKWRLSYRNNPWFVQRGIRQATHFREDGVEMFSTEAFGWFSATLEHWTVPHQGKYRIRFSGSALRSDEAIPVTMRAGGAGFHGSFTGATTTLGFYDLEPDEPQVYEWEGWLERGRYIHIYPTLLPLKRYGKDQADKNLAYDGPGALINWVEVEGPFYKNWPPASHRVLYGDLPLAAIDAATPTPDPNEHLRTPPKPKKIKATVPLSGPAYKRAVAKSIVATHRLDPDDRYEDAERLIRRFARRAYRRPVANKDVDRFVRLVHHWLDEGSGFEEAMRIGFKAILTSPQFLFFDESPGPLDDYALASRLSYFLWGTPPDAELMKEARAGTLKQPATLRQQAERLLNDHRHENFTRGFVDQWLELKHIDLTSPDILLYPEYDELLRHSSLEETYQFFDELLRENLPVQNFIDSDFTILNRRLAKLYGISGVDGSELRRVALPKDSVRGGVLTQASVLKVTANGTTTSPIVRGVWTLDRIIGKPSPPPPPGVPAVEPDIRGASTIREQLAKHREIGSCARCHKYIDPPGFALECFDPIGNERTNYRVLKPGKPPERAADILLNIHYQNGPQIDISYDFADGSHFDTVDKFKQILLGDRELIARTVTAKLLTYGTGAGISFSDRAEVQAIVDRTKMDDFGLRSIVHAIVQSRLFLNK